ncbi:DUF2927 domain-containing protein, partial [Phaeodactylibacter sp.]
VITVIALLWTLHPFYQSYQAKQNIEERKELEAEHRERGGYKATTVEECINEEACVWYAFKGIALGAEIYGDGNNLKNAGETIKKRTEDTEFLIDADLTKEQLEYLKDHLTKINNLTQFKVSAIYQGKGDYIIYSSHDPFKDIHGYLKNELHEIYDNDYLYNKIISTLKDREGICFANSFFNEDTSVISAGLIFLNYNFFKECTEEEITQSLGLMNDINGFQFSAFNDGAIIKMTKLDWLLFEILYDDRIKAGMNINEVQEIFPQIYQDKLTNYGGLET